MIATSVQVLTDAGIDLDDPIVFARLCWPHKPLYDKQEEIALSVRDNIQTFVPSANEMGKTFLAAVLAIWWYATRTPSRIVMFSASQEQLNTALWAEMKELIAESRMEFNWRVVEHKITKYKDLRRREVRELDYLVAHVTTEVEKFQGKHLPEDRARVLVIFDEASAVPDGFLSSAETFSHRILCIGNPMNNLNFFYRCYKEGDVPNPIGENLLRKVIQLDGEMSPNVKAGRLAREKGLPPPPPLVPGVLSYEWMVRRESLWDEETQARCLHGVFWEGAESMLTPYEWLDHAMSKSRWEKLNKTERRPVAMGVDVAEGGSDKTIWTVIDRSGVVSQTSYDGGDAVEIAKRTMQLADEHHLFPNQIAIDAGGGGKQVGDFLRHGLPMGDGSTRTASLKVVAFGESPGADDTGRGKGKKKRMAWSDIDPTKAYKNRRAEMYGNLRSLLNPVQPDGREPFMLGPDAWELRKELQPIPMLHDGEGKMYLPPKDEGSAAKKGVVCLRKLIGHSPDRADSLVLAIHAMLSGRNVAEAAAKVTPGFDKKQMEAVQERFLAGVAERMKAAKKAMAGATSAKT